MNKNNTRFYVLVPVLAALIAVATVIIPPIRIGAIPITLQVLVVALIAYLFDTKTSVTAVVLYIIVGLIGIPVFSGPFGGLGIITMPTFGFILGFIPFCFLISTLKFSPKENNTPNMSMLLKNVLVGVAAIIVLYVFGYIQMYFIKSIPLTTFFNIMSTFFVIDLIKIIVAVFLSRLFLPIINQIFVEKK